MGQYKTLIRVAELKNVTKAAEELGYSQPNISYAIRKAEEELGVRLFNRGNRSILSLTQAGAQLLPLMQEVERVEQSIAQVARAYQSEVLRIGSFYSVSAYWIPAILKSFIAQYPDVKITIIERDSYAALETMLERGDIDCSFYANTFNKKFDHIHLYEDDYYVITSQDHPLAREESVSLDELSKYPFIPPSEALCASIAQNTLRRIQAFTNISAQSQEDLATVNLVEQGLGISLLPGLIALNTTRNIRAIPLKEKVSRDVGILCISKHDAPAIVKSFIAATKAFVSALP